MFSFSTIYASFAVWCVSKVSVFASFLVTVNAMERTEIKINIIAEQLGLSWAGESSVTQSVVLDLQILQKIFNFHNELFS